MANQLIIKFEVEFAEGNIHEAIETFERIEALQVPISKTTRFNAAQCYYMNSDTTNAFLLFEETTTSNTSIITSRAYNMLARLSLDKADTLEAINTLRKGILVNSNNEELIYNYELLKKKFKNNQNQPPSGGNNTEKKEKEINGYAAKTDDKDDVLNNTNPPKINREQALLILDALKEKEIYFIPREFKDQSEDNTYGKW